MADMRRLERTLAENVTRNKARINFLAKFTVALVQVKTVSLAQISAVMGGRNQTRTINAANASFDSSTCRLPK